MMQTYPLKKMTIEGVTWHYYAIGKGSHDIVIFLSILVFPKEWQFFIEHLPQKYRVIIPLYPPIADYQILIRHLTLLLKELGVRKMTLLGNSLGGILAQVYACTNPHQVEKLILVATIAPSKLYGFLASLLAAVGKFVPGFLIPYVVWLGAWLSLSQRGTPLARELLSHIQIRSTKPYVMALGTCIIDICLYYRQRVASSIPVVVIEGDRDIVFPFFVHNLAKRSEGTSYYKIEKGKHLFEIDNHEMLLNMLQAELISH